MADPVLLRKSASGLSGGQPGPLGHDNLISVFEAGLEPLAQVFTLWAVALYFEGELPGSYIILSIIAFSVSFPGTPRLNDRWTVLVGNLLMSWLVTAGLLLGIGILTGYMAEFSRQALLAWLVLTPVVQLLGHVALRQGAPYLISLQGPAQRAVIVGMNDQGVALASRVGETPYSRIDFYGFFDDRDLERLDASGDFRMLGRLAELPDFVREHNIQLI